MRLSVPVLKTITYRVAGTLASYMITYILTGSIKIGLTVAFIDLLVKPLLYFLHEILWEWIQKRGYIEK